MSEETGLRLISLLGVFAMPAIAWLFSRARGRMPWRTVLAAIALQLALGLLLLKTVPGRHFFVAANAAVNNFLEFSKAGGRFVFGGLMDTGFSFALELLPIIIFVGSLFSVLYHLRVVQWLVRGMAHSLSRLLGTSGAESLAATANVFIGMTEAPLLIRPYIKNMTQSELFTLMVTGMATIAGSVLVAYANLLGEAEYAGHLVAASLMSAPAAIAVAKVMQPECETPETARGQGADAPSEAVNVVDAAARGATIALRLAVNVIAMLIAFIALIALVNALLAWCGGWLGMEDLSLQKIFGVIFAPLAWLMGVPWHDAQTVGSLLGVKTALNEFLAYQALGEMIEAGTIDPRSAVIASYALCGFANFGSIAILVGGVGGIVPERRSDLAQLGLRAVLAGTLATMMTGCIAGVLL